MMDDAQSRTRAPSRFRWSRDGQSIVELELTTAIPWMRACRPTPLTLLLGTRPRSSERPLGRLLLRHGEAVVIAASASALGRHPELQSQARLPPLRLHASARVGQAVRQDGRCSALAVMGDRHGRVRFSPGGDVCGAVDGRTVGQLEHR